MPVRPTDALSPAAGARPRVSVVIPCYNAALFLAETIRSALGQTCAPAEVIVVDDGSTDDSARVARSFGPPVRLVCQPNQGESVARNRGVEEAAGEWVAFLDADDVWEPNKLELQWRAAENDPTVVCIYCAHYTFGRRSSRPPLPAPEACNVETLLLEPLIHISTAMVQRSLPVRFPVWTRDSEDMIYFAELAVHGRFAQVPLPLVGYRVHAAMQTRTPGHKVRSWTSRRDWLLRDDSPLDATQRARLHELLGRQLVDWIHHARWHRDWQTYWALRELAAGLPWQEPVPAVLRERPYPRAVYAVRDQWRAIASRFRRQELPQP
jgi:glycosyltransferase involved in cell wall biosynthesis